MYKGTANNNSFETPRENIIKAAIINNFARKTAKEFIVCNELTFSSHNRIADLVFCKENKTYAFEIKAWTDDFRRLGPQLDMYCRIFDYIYLAITSNHISSIASLPSYVGIIHFSRLGSIKYIRKATRNPNIDKQEILMSIPISFIREHSSQTKYTRSNNDLISLKETKGLFSKYLHSKYRWTDSDLASVLHYEDIIRNPDYIKL